MSDSAIRNTVAKADWLAIVLVIMLVACGWFTICGASNEIGDTDFLSWGTRSGKQLVWIGCSAILALFLLMLDDRYFDMLAPLLYVLMAGVLFITPFVAHGIKGSHSWISLGPVSIQPAEFAKCTTALMIAKVLSRYGFTLSDNRNLLKAIGIILLPMALIILQKETGSALVYCAFFLMFYREGMPGSILFTAVAAVTYFVVGIRFSADVLPHTYSSVGESVVLTLIWLFSSIMVGVYGRMTHCKQLLLYGLGVHAILWLTSRFIITFDIAWGQIAWLVIMACYIVWLALGERIRSYYYIAVFALGSSVFLYGADFAMNNILGAHQRTRINVLLGIENDPTGSGYNVNQSKIAIGSGGLTGKGFMNGTQTKLKYVPEQDTDFIFCTVGEEQGFAGCAVVLCLFMALILRLIYLAERQSTTFGRVFGYSVLSIILFHVFINIGMVMGLTPVIGIPLPFFSYGGSSLWGFTLLIFIFLRIDARDRLRN